MVGFKLSTKKLLKLVQVDAVHTYYADQVCKDFDFIPTPETDKVLRNHRLIFKPTPEGFIVFYHVDQSTPLLKSPAFRPEKLSFLIQQSNNRFPNFSALPFPSGESIFVFDNLHKSKVGDQQCLHPEPHVAPDHPQVLRAEKMFELQFEKEVAYDKLVLTDALGQTLQLPVYPDARQKLVSERHLIQLQDYPYGLYTISAGAGKKDQSFTVYTTEPAYDRCFGVIDLYLNSIVPKEKQMADDKGIYPQDYALRIAARETHWKYIIVPQQGDARYSDHKIQLKDKSIKFSAPQPMQLPKGVEATTLISQNPIPLRQRPEHRLELMMKKNGKSLRNAVSLPVPSVDFVKPDLQQPDKMYSEVYVYV